ncbi:hypothetical protein RhiJN_08405 [Ceratobasidium sp. AG-Ba]|nr:hypothetical protein RhiJN_08405 [Ceratobasidium sp. AG-Ba]QRW09186.1 hypothetical protein RhiLY_08185 [Ceratobasidium sp. AG-Ba]
MADRVQSDPGSAPSSGAPGGTRVIDPAKLKAMRDHAEAKFAGTQQALERNTKAEAEGRGGTAEQGAADEKKGLRAQRMEGIVKHHDD